jgi:hypothetical protein
MAAPSDLGELGGDRPAVPLSPVEMLLFVALVVSIQAVGDGLVDVGAELQLVE